MSGFSVVALAAATAVLAATPGPGVLATISKAISSGYAQASRLVLGIVAGDLVFLSLAMLGLGAVAEALGSLFLVVRWLGAAYLIWLGWRLWRSADEARPELAGPSSGGFRSGFLLTLGNPKVIAFYIGFLPAFIDLSELRAGEFALVAAVVSGVLLLVLLSYAYAAARVRPVLRSRLWRRRINRSAGAAMVGAGAAAAANY